jgi:hypothetical protein
MRHVKAPEDYNKQNNSTLVRFGLSDIRDEEVFTDKNEEIKENGK